MECDTEFGLVPKKTLDEIGPLWPTWSPVADGRSTRCAAVAG